jgi:Lar family restriction alleviation protein
MMEVLKPCPFCGGKARIKWDKWRYDDLDYYVECECGVSTGVYKNLANAVKAWNRRIEK